MESLSSPGRLESNICYCNFSFTFIGNPAKIKVCHLYVSVLWGRIIEAHTQRRLPKTSSTLTVSSDDLDERDLASESGLLLPFYAPVYILQAFLTLPNHVH